MKEVTEMVVKLMAASRVGAAARAIGLIKGEVVLGIPVSITGKSIYYDRQTPKH